MTTYAAANTEDALIATPDRHNHQRALILIPVLALFIVHPLIAHGCSCGHDFDFHLLSWFEAAAQISHGNLHPHWAFTPAWDAGEPRFVFYPPLSWYLGALIGLALIHLPHVSEAAAWAAAPIVFTWAALTLSGLTMYRLARKYAISNVALIAATIYMVNPYMLFTAYERTAYGELLAAAWMPLLFDAALRERISIPCTAVPIALLWLTNVPAAVMGCYALALLAAVRITLETKHGIAGRSAVRCVAGLGLGLALAAFYVLPVAYERRFVQSSMALVGGTRIEANFLFEHTGVTLDDRMHDAVLLLASWIAVTLLVATCIALITAWRRNRSPSSSRHLSIALLTTLTFTVAFLLTPLSAPIWHHAPELAFLQFPWRLLALLTPILAQAIAVAISSFRSAQSESAPSPRIVLTTVFIAAILGLPAWHLFHQPCDPSDTATARLALFHSNSGTDPTDEYTPVTADNDALRPGNPPYWLSDSPDADAASPDHAFAVRTAPTHLAIAAPHSQLLILNLRDYPAWHITLTRPGDAPQAIQQRSPRADGLIAIPIPAGPSMMDIRYAQTADQTAGDAISLIALGAFTMLAVRKRSAATLPI
jgi:hypothetical protein